jgi:hypothetical protein
MTLVPPSDLVWGWGRFTPRSTALRTDRLVDGDVQECLPVGFAGAVLVLFPVLDALAGEVFDGRCGGDALSRLVDRNRSVTG